MFVLFDQEGQWRSAVADLQASTITWPKPSWDGLGWVGPQSEGKAANKCSAHLGTPSKLLKQHSWWLPREAEWENAKRVPSCHQSKWWLLRIIYNITYSSLFNTFLVYYIIPYVFLHSLDVFSINLQCRSKIKTNCWIRRCVQTLDCCCPSHL